MRVSKVTIVHSRRPTSKNLNEELQWLGASLGLFGLRDKDKSCFRLFIMLLKSVPSEKGMSSDQLAARLGLSRGTVVHHLNRLMEAGIVTSSRQRYFLASSGIEATIQQLQDEVNSVFEDLRKVAKELDERLEL